MNRPDCYQPETIVAGRDSHPLERGAFHGARGRRGSAATRSAIATSKLEPAVRDIFLIGFYTGMRRGEIYSLRWERIDLDRRILRVDETKTGEPLELPITRQLATIFER